MATLSQTVIIMKLGREMRRYEPGSHKAVKSVKCLKTHFTFFTREAREISRNFTQFHAALTRTINQEMNYKMGDLKIKLATAKPRLSLPRQPATPAAEQEPAGVIISGMCEFLHHDRAARAVLVF